MQAGVRWGWTSAAVHSGFVSTGMRGTPYGRTRRRGASRWGLVAPVTGTANPMNTSMPGAPKTAGRVSAPILMTATAHTEYVHSNCGDRQKLW